MRAYVFIIVRIIGGYSKNDKGVATQIVSAFYVPATYNNILISNLYTIVPMPTMLLYVIGYVVYQIPLHEVNRKNIISFYFKINFLSPLLTLKVRCRSAVTILSVGYTIADTL